MRIGYSVEAKELASGVRIPSEAKPSEEWQ
jgi:hypothetical protein